MGKKVAKFVGIGILCVVAVLGIGIGIFALTGGFDQTVIALTSLYFDEQSVETEGYVMNIQDVRTEDEAALSIKKYIVISEDYKISIGCLPSDATNTTLEVTISQVTAAIEVPKTVKAGEKFTIKVKKDANGKNIGGSAKLSFKSESGVSCELYVIVDVVLEDSDIKLDVSGFSSISPSTATGSSLGGNNRYVLARKNGMANLTLESDLANAFKINQSGISNKDFADNSVVKFFDKKVYVFAEQEGVVSIEQNKTAPVTYDITLNLEQVQGSNLTLYVRTHRTYEMQQEFESLGLDAFTEYYREGLFEEDQIENTFNNQSFALNYVELIYKYSNFVNKYYDYIVKDRNSSEFFEQFRNSSGEIAFSESGDLFLSQVWESLKYVYVNSDIDLFISDIDIKTMKVLADTPYIMEVFENKSLTLEELISAFEIILENDDTTVLVEEEEKLALLSNMVVGIYVEDGTKTETNSENLEDKLKELYNVGTLQNGNGLTYDEEEKGISIESLYLNNKFVTLSRDGNNFNLEALVPSKYVNDKNFQIYIVFSIAITKSTGTTSIFYDFGKIDVTYEEEVGFEGGMPYSNISYIDEMCINNNNAIPEDTEVFNGAIGSQTIEVNMNMVLGANATYAVPKFFVEKTSNEYSYTGVREYYEVGAEGSEKKVVGMNGEKPITYTGLDISGYPLREFVKMEGDTDERYTYMDKILQAYELPVTHKFDLTGVESDRNIYTVDITAINALNDGSIKIFWVCVLVDKDKNPIDRDGNRLFNDNGQAIVGGDMGNLLENENVKYVMIYSSLDIGAADYFQNIGINTVAILENINFYTQNLSENYFYVEDGELKYVPQYAYYLRNNRDSVNEAYTKLRLITREKYDEIMVVSGFNLVYHDGMAYPSFTADELTLASEKGIDLYGNIYRSMEGALAEENFGFMSSRNDYVVAMFDNNKIDPVDDGGTEPAVTDTIFWNISLEAFEFDRLSAQTICSLSLNTNCKLYDLLDDCLVRIQVDSPTITKISAVNNDRDTNENKIVSLENFNKQIFIDGEFSTLENANAGEIDWKYSYDVNGEIVNTIYSFYLPGSYKVSFSISTEGSNMNLLTEYYESEIKRIINEIGDESQVEETLDQYLTLYEKVIALNQIVEDFNRNGKNIVGFNPLDENNIVDMCKNNIAYISEYLNKLIHNNLNKIENPSVFNFTGDIDDALSLIQNYGIFVEITNDDTLKDKLDLLKTALSDFKDVSSNVIFQNDIDILKAIELADNATEFTAEDLGKIQAVMTKILNNSPTYDDDFVNVRTVLRSIYKYNLKDLADKFIKVYKMEEDYFKDCVTSSDIIQAIINSEKVSDPNGNGVIELFEIIKLVNDQIERYNDTVSSAQALSEVSYEEITDNFDVYFEDGKLLSTKEIVLNEDGTLPLKTGFRDNLVLNIGLQFRFYPTETSPGVTSYRYTIEKEFSFYMNFKGVSLDIEEGSIMTDAGDSVDLKDKIKLEGISLNHVTLEIPFAYQDFLYFLDGENRVYSTKASTTTMLYIDNIANEDKYVNILVSVPYYDANGNQLAGTIEVVIKHNFVIEFDENIKFVSSVSKKTASEVLEGEVGYYDLTNYVVVKNSEGNESSDLTIKIDSISSNTILLENNILKIAAYNISGRTINLTIKLYSGEKLVATFTKAIEILPYYKVDINTNKLNVGENGQTYYVNQILYNHFNIYDLDLVQVSKIILPDEGNNDPADDYSYKLLSLANLEERAIIESIVGYSGIHANENSQIEELPSVKVFGIDIKSQFYVYNETDKTYGDPTYLGENLKNWLVNGVVNLPREMSKTVILPIKLNFAGYMSNSANMFIYLKVCGIEKLENVDGEGNVEDLSTYDKSPYENSSDNFVQNFSTISLNAGGEYNLDEYIQLVLSETNSGDEFNILKISYELANAVEGVEFKEENNTASLMVDEQAVSINGVISIGEEVADETIITLNLKIYKILESGASITAEEIEYVETLTIVVSNQQEVTE